MDERALASPDDQDVLDTVSYWKTCMERVGLKLAIDLDVTPRVDHTRLRLHLEADIRKVCLSTHEVVIQVKNRAEEALASITSM